jgi:hypothetical protein
MSIVWSDPAGKVNSAFQLVNNLDLFVVNNATQQLVFGNNHYFHDIDGDHWVSMPPSEHFDRSRFNRGWV